MKIAIVGSRTFFNYDLVVNSIEEKKEDIELIVSGGAKGADSLAQRYAQENGRRLLVIYPDWNFYGKQAGFIRNLDIIKACDKVYAFWDGVSRGTKHTITNVLSHGKELRIIKYETCSNTVSGI